MFDRFGWICNLCNNFNFESRSRCNRCYTIINPKSKKEIFNEKYKKKNKNKKIKKSAWFCLNCQNLNYGFKDYCNKCKIEKKENFPLLYLDPNRDINDDNIKKCCSKIFGKYK